ncbi:hypothetical protein KBD87_00360 [Candidatus Saccharibacteria bacterium]|jgi:hypothetical protein|nr:hypothetical protein [Candidatus Saccharibacteria bacterium]
MITLSKDQLEQRIHRFLSRKADEFPEIFEEDTMTKAWQRLRTFIAELHMYRTRTA